MEKIILQRIQRRREAQYFDRVESLIGWMKVDTLEDTAKELEEMGVNVRVEDDHLLVTFSGVKVTALEFIEIHPHAVLNFTVSKHLGFPEPMKGYHDIYNAATFIKMDFFR